MLPLLALFSLIYLSSAQFINNPIFLNESYATGFLPTVSGAELFYIAFESRNQPETDPLVIWLTGGPGCSGELALFTENGPFTINSDDSSLSINPYSWNNMANLLYVDQPAGTGYSSVVTYLTDESDIAEDFYSFFTGFLETFPQYKARPLFITGESYSGHYIPAIGAYFLQQGNSDINLQGVAIGNGWVDPVSQYPAYSIFAYQRGLINESQYQNFSQQVPICNEGLLSGNIIDEVVNCSSIIGSITGNPRAFNIYDIRLPCIGSLCYNFTPVVEFLQIEAVQEALNVTGKHWVECSSKVSEYLTFDHQVSYASNVTYLLNNGVPVLAYSGIEDFICNYIGGEAWTSALDYPGHEEFINSQYFPFGEYGLYKGAQGLTWFLIIGAGHLASMDQPSTCVDMLNTFMAGGFQN